MNMNNRIVRRGIVKRLCRITKDWKYTGKFKRKSLIDTTTRITGDILNSNRGV